MELHALNVRASPAMMTFTREGWNVRIDTSALSTTPSQHNRQFAQNNNNNTNKNNRASFSGECVQVGVPWPWASCLRLGLSHAMYVVFHTGPGRLLLASSSSLSSPPTSTTLQVGLSVPQKRRQRASSLLSSFMPWIR